MGGALLFFVSEYGMHRYVLHAPPSAIPWLRRLQNRLHYNHHAQPNDLSLLFLPLWFALPAIGITWGVTWLFYADHAARLSMVAGAALATLYYEWVHYVAHIQAQPITPWGRWMKKYHLRHHFQNEGVWFGVTNPALDRVLGTMPDPKSTARSDTVRQLWPTSPPEV